MALGRLGTSLGVGRAYGGNYAGYSQLLEYVGRTTGPPIESWVEGDMLGVRPSSACWGAVESRQAGGDEEWSGWANATSAGDNRAGPSPESAGDSA